MITALLIFILAFMQDISFTMLSRSRNRDNMTYYGICSVFANSVWFLTMHQLVVADLSYWLIAPYIVGTLCGSLLGAKISMCIERLIGAKT